MRQPRRKAEYRKGSNARLKYLADTISASVEEILTYVENSSDVRTSRIRAINILRDKGWTMQAIADLFGISKQRVYQLLGEDNV